MTLRTREQKSSFIKTLAREKESVLLWIFERQSFCGPHETPRLILVSPGNTSKEVQVPPWSHRTVRKAFSFPPNDSDSFLLDP